MSLRLLAVDLDPALLDALARLGVTVDSATGEAALARAEHFDAVLISPARLRAEYPDATHAQLHAAEQRAATFSTLLEVGQTLASRTIEDPGLVLQTIVEGAARVTGADCVVIYPYDNERHSYDAQLVRAVGVREPLTPRETARSATGLSMSIVAKGRMIVEDVLADDGLREAKFNQREGIRSFAALSLLAGDEPVGLLFVNFRAPHRFTPDEEKLIDLFGNQAAVAIANSRLHHKVYVNLSRYIHELEEKYKLMATIIAIQDSLDLEAVLVRVLDRALALSRAHHGWICLVNEAQTDYAVRAARGERRTEEQPLAPLAGTLAGRAVREARAFILGDVTAPEWAATRAEWLPDVRSVLLVPLMETLTAIGLICITSEDAEAFTAEDALELQKLAPEIVLAVRNARAYAQAKQEIDNLSRLLEIGPMVFQPLRLKDTLAAIVAQAQAALPEVDILTLYHKDEAEGRIRLAGEYGVRGHKLADTRSQEDNVVARMLAEKQVIIAPDVTREPRLMGRFVQREEVVSAMAVPLSAGEQTLGAMFVNYRRRHIFHEREIHLINLFATYAAAAIDKARQYEALERQRRYLEALHEASAHIAFSLNVDDILTSILHQAQALTNAWVCTYQLVEGAELVFIQTVPPEYLAEFQRAPGRLAIGRGITGWAAQEKAPVYIADVQQHPDYIRPGQLQPFAEMAIPLMDGAECLGVINLELRAGGLDAETRALMVTLADDAAIALRNARLFEQAERRADIFKQLREIALHITSNLDLQRVLEAVARGAMTVLEADVTTVFIVERAPTAAPAQELETGTRYLGLMFDGQQVSRVDEEDWPKPRGLAARVFRSGQSAVVPLVTEELLTRESRVVREKNIGALVCAPLKIGRGQVLGVLYVDHCHPHHFSEEEVQTIELFAAQAALAVQNAQRYHELENARDRAFATEAVAWMGLIGSEWTHDVNQKTFSIATYLTGLDLLAQRLEALSADAAEQLRAGLAGIRATADSIRQVPLTRTEGMYVVVAPTRVDEEIERLVRQWSRPHPNVRLEFRLRCPGVAVNIEPQWFTVALEKLVSNALRALSGRGQLTVSSERVGEAVRLTLHDTGPGLPAYAREHFLKQRIEKPQNVESSGTGAGVLIARFILLSHNGALELSYSSAERGTELVVTLPMVEEAVSHQLSAISSQ